MEENRVLWGTTERIGHIPPLDFGTLAFEEAQGPGCRVICLHDVSCDAFDGFLKSIAVFPLCSITTL